MSDPAPRKRKGGGQPVGETLGGILAGFDQQVLRRQPPAHELVLKGSPVRGLAGDDPRDLEIVLPDREGEDDPEGRGRSDPERSPPATPR
jgi:hypothetical protein